jgi:hypothetical protein
MLELYTVHGEGPSLDQAIENAEALSADTLELAMTHKRLEMLNISSETLYANGRFYYIIKTLVNVMEPLPK